MSLMPGYVLRQIISRFPETRQEHAWVGVCWRVRRATIAHVFGGEDQLFRITFRADAGEVRPSTSGPHVLPSRAGAVNLVGLLLDGSTDWNELAELLTDSYCLQAPPTLAERVRRP